MEIKTAWAVYTGGNIWLFYGSLEDGNFFLTDDNGCTLIINTDPSDLDESTFPDWQEEHLVRELENNERMQFCNVLLDWILEHPNNDGGMTEQEIEVYRNWFKSELY